VDVVQGVRQAYPRPGGGGTSPRGGVREPASRIADVSWSDTSTAAPTGAADGPSPVDGPTEEQVRAALRGVIDPELGADMLRDLGIYGPVAEIVLAHHERIDGRGYPNGIGGEEIPEIAKIISVAEVYDTLTASDTYRTQMSSFEALRELRRVSGSQLDERYVEVLAGLLSGEGVEYRHADMADFDTELNMERRIREASAGA